MGVGGRAHLVEREEQLDALERFFARAVAGSGATVLIAGEAGIGKTALVEAFCKRHVPDCRVLVGRCDPLSTPRPLGPLLDIAPRLGSRLEVLLGTGDRPALVFDEALKQLRSEATVVVFEDLHWADEATLDIVRFLGRRLADGKTMFVCTYRDDELGPSHPLRVALGDLWGSPAVHRIALPPLTAAAVRELADGTEFDPVSLHTLTAGNPFFVAEVLAAAEDGIPATVRDAVFARLARLSDLGRHAMEVAAVFGDRVDLGRLLHGFGVEDDAITECVASGMLIPSDIGVDFRHQLVRKAVLDSIAPSRRAELHSKVLVSARRRGIMPDELAELAEHAEFARDSDAVLEFAPAAAQWASRLGAHREASAQYGRAVRFAEGSPVQTIAPLIEGWAHELDLLGKHEEVLVLREKAAEMWSVVGDKVREADNLRWSSRSLLRSGRYEDAQKMAGLAIYMLEELPAGPELAWAYGNQAHILATGDRAREALKWSEKSLALAKRLGEQELVIYSLNDHGFARLSLGDETGRDDLEESLRLAAEYGLAEHVLRAHVNLAAYYIASFDPLPAERHLDAVLDDAAGFELEDLRLHLLTLRAWHRLLTGSWNDASEDASNALDVPSSFASTSVLALAVLAQIAARTGRFQEASAYIDRALAGAARVSNVIWHIHQISAEVAWLRGDSAELRRAAAASARAFEGEMVYVAPAVDYWLWRSGQPINQTREVKGPLALEILGRWTEAAAEWDRRGCSYEAAIATLASEDKHALVSAVETFERLGAEPAADMARRKLRQLGVTARRRPSKTTRAHPAGLTRREAEVLDLLSIGLTNPQIAKRLFLAPKTVEHHVSSLLAKLGAANRTDAVRIAKETPHPEATASTR